MNRPTVLVAGHLTHDRIATGFTPGGCAYYAGEVYARLGASVHLAVTVGEDFQFDELLRDTSCTVHRAGQTTVFANIYPGADHPRVQLLECAAPPVPPTGLPDAYLRADIVHLAPVISELDIRAWIQATSARIVAINVQGWVRRAGAPVDPVAMAELAGPAVAAWARGRHVASAPWAIQAEELAGVHVAFLSEEDLVGQGDLLDRLRQAVPIVALTDGAKGCRIFERDPSTSVEKITRVGTYRTTEVEATGAGDTFAAGLLCQLAAGASPAEAARFGAAAASIIVEGEGASTLDRIHEAHQRVADVPILT